MSARQASGGQVRVGTDLVYVPDVTASIDRFGRRYLRRVYTDSELATCAVGSGWAADRLAARFAAKEAAIKVLRLDGPIAYRDVEVVLAKNGAPHVRFAGDAQVRVDSLGLGNGSLSMSHDGQYAMAVFVATVESG